MKSEKINEIAGALAKAQMEMTSATKDCVNPHYRSKYADINSLLLSCRPILAKHGIAICQIPEMTDKGVVLTSGLYHESSGQWFEGIMPITIKTGGNNDLQALGSCISYLRRYCLAAMVGIASDDDDGNEGKAYQVKQEHAKKETVTVPQVTSDQVAEVRSMLALCDNAYISKIMDWLATYKITNLETMPVTFYSTIKTRVQAHLDVPQTAIVGDA